MIWANIKLPEPPSMFDVFSFYIFLFLFWMFGQLWMVEIHILQHEMHMLAVHFWALDGKESRP